ncbi:MAG: hypothetical protein APF80_01015 [Alphaproteobacteria bacterium BRH_c36]|nr:MAG: hypothetical protein APF80_01015 [Alphaproteobacteria bacterium BRH_c36]
MNGSVKVSAIRRRHNSVPLYPGRTHTSFAVIGVLLIMLGAHEPRKKKTPAAFAAGVLFWR